MYLISLIVGILILIVIFKITPYLHETYVFHKTISKIPAPPQLPFFGIAFQLLRMARTDRIQFLHRMLENFKDGLFCVYVIGKPFVMISAPKHLQTILSCTENIQKPYVYRFLHPWLGEGLLTSKGERWSHDRKLLTPAFHFNILAEFVPTIREKAEVFVACIDKELKKKPEGFIDVFSFAVKATLDILSETAMGVNMNVQKESNVEYVNALHTLSELVLHRGLSPWLQLDFFFNASPTGRKFNESVRKMHNLTKEIIRKRKEERKEQMKKPTDTSVEDEDIGRRKKKAMLDILLEASEVSEGLLTDDQIREQVDTFLFAGHDSVATALSWTLFCLGNDLEHQEKVHEELQAVFGDSQEPLTLNHLSDLKCLERVVKEALRLYPSAPIIGREITKDIIIDGYTIPKGTKAIINPYMAHRIPEYWPDPLKFDPDRFLPENLKNRHPYAYIPFSAGPRNCIGQRFALMELKIMLAAILRKWRVKSVLNHDEIKIFITFILRPNDTVDIYFIEK